MAERPSILNNTSSPRMDLELVDKTIDTFSTASLWEKSYLCPCKLKETRQPDQTCKLCHGRGTAFFPPKPIEIMIQSQEKGVFNGDIGVLDSGTAIGTTERSVQVSFRDRITVTYAKISQSILFDVSQRRVDKGFYMVYDVNEIEFATTMQGELVEGKDYTVDLQNNTFYPKPHLLGENVSLNVLTTLRYMVTDLLKEYRYAKTVNGVHEKLPQKLLLKREDVFIGKEALELGMDEEAFTEMIDVKRKPASDGLNGFFRGGGM